MTNQLRAIPEAFQFYCLPSEMLDGSAQLEAIQVSCAETAVPLASWPINRIQTSTVMAVRGKVLRESLELALDWCWS